MDMSEELARRNETEELAPVTEAIRTALHTGNRLDIRIESRGRIFLLSMADITGTDR